MFVSVCLSVCLSLSLPSASVLQDTKHYKQDQLNTLEAAQQTPSWISKGAGLAPRSLAAATPHTPTMHTPVLACWSILFSQAASPSDLRMTALN